MTFHGLLLHHIARLLCQVCHSLVYLRQVLWDTSGTLGLLVLHIQQISFQGYCLSRASRVIIIVVDSPGLESVIILDCFNHCLHDA